MVKDDAISRFSRAGGGPGSGLDLPISACVVENHGGHLEILHHAAGASMPVTLPRAHVGIAKSRDGNLPRSDRARWGRFCVRFEVKYGIA